MGNQIEYYSSQLRDRFDTSAEPTLEDEAGTDSLNRTIADGDQIADVVDGDRNGRLTIPTATAAYRADIALDRRIDGNILILDNHNARDVYPGDERNHQTLHTDTDATFSGATQVTVTQEYAGLIGAERAFLDFAEGTDVITVTDAAVIQDIFDGGGSLECMVNVRSDGGGDAGRLFDKGDWILSTQSESGSAVKLKFDVTFGGTNGAWTTTDTVLTIGTWHHVVLSYDSSSTTNDPVIYIDGVSVAITENATPTLIRTSDAGGNLFIGNNSGSGTRGFDGLMKDIAAYNDAVSAAEALARSNGGEIPIADRWAQVYYESDFSAGVDGWTDAAMTLTGNIDGISDGTTSLDNVLRAVTDAGSSTHQFRILDQVTDTDKDVGSQILYLIPSGQSNVDGFQLRSGPSGVVFDARSTGSNPAVIGTWTLLAENYTPADANENDLRIVPYDGASETFDDVGGDDIIYIATAKQVQAGAAMDLASEGIATTQSTVFDRSTNSNDGAIQGAEGRNNPGNSIYFAKFTEVNAKFWFLQLNDDGLTYTAAYKVGQWDICKTFRPSHNPDVTGVIPGASYDGIVPIQKYGGGLDLNEQYGRRRTWQFSYSFLTDADIALMIDLYEQSKKRPFYFSDNADDAEPRIYAVRALENPSYPRPAFGAHNHTIALIEEV